MREKYTVACEIKYHDLEVFSKKGLTLQKIEL